MNRTVTVLATCAALLLPLQALSATAATTAKPADAKATTTTTTTTTTKTVAKHKGKKITDMVADMQKRLKETDTDGDGYVTRAETKAYKVAKQKEYAAKKAAASKATKK